MTGSTKSILAPICKEYSIDISDLYTSVKRSTRNITEAKQMAILYMRNVLKMKRREIIRELGYKDETTVRWHIKKAVGIMSVDSAFATRYNEMQDKIARHMRETLMESDTEK